MRWSDPRAQPPVGAPIQWGHELSAGLTNCWIMNSGAGLRTPDRVGARHLDFAAISSADQLGFGGYSGLLLNGTSTTKIAILTAYTWPLPLTISALVRPMVVDSAYRFINRSSDAGLGGLGISSGNKWTVYSGGGIDIVSGVTPVVGKDYLVTMTYDGVISRLYLNGRPDVTYTTTQTFSSSTNRFGGDNFSQPFGGIVSNYMVWKRAMRAKDVEWLYGEPYAMFQPQRVSRMYSVPTTSRVIMTPLHGILYPVP